MDGFTEKKWFVYLNDHHEGPFSLEEIQTRMGQGQLTSANFVWAEGMGDWKMMSEVQAFESILAPAAPPPPAAPAPVLTGGPELAPVLSAAGPASGFAAISLESVGPVEPVALQTSSPAISTEAPYETEADATQTSMISPLTHGEHKKALMKQMTKLGLLLLLLGGIGIAFNEGYFNPLLNSQSVKGILGSVSNITDPILMSLGFSPIPKLEDVDAEDFEQLKSAAKVKVEQGGQIALAMSKTDPLAPTFYVGSNLPDGTILDLYFEGIPDSLLNQLSFTAKTQVTITKKFGKTPAIEFPQGARAFVRGQYMLYVVDPETQPAAARPMLAKMQPATSQIAPASVPRGLRVLAAKTLFLGGPKDAAYTSRLQEYHQKIQAKAQGELSELKQIMATYDSQLAETNQKFSGLKKGKKVTPGQKKAWEGFHNQWSALNQQLSAPFVKLNSDALDINYFYGFMYKLCQQVGEKVGSLHELQSTYFAGTVADPKAFEIQVGEANAIAHSSIEELKTRINQIENTPPTPNGLPKREGI